MSPRRGGRAEPAAVKHCPHLPCPLPGASGGRAGARRAAGQQGVRNGGKGVAGCEEWRGGSRSDLPSRPQRPAQRGRRHLVAAPRVRPVTAGARPPLRPLPPPSLCIPNPCARYFQSSAAGSVIRALTPFESCAVNISEVMSGLAGNTRHYRQLNLPQKYRGPALAAAKVSQVEEERL